MPNSLIQLYLRLNIEFQNKNIDIYHMNTYKPSQHLLPPFQNYPNPKNGGE